MSTLKSTFLTSLVAILLLAACSDDETTLPIDNDPDDTPMDTMTMSMDTMTMSMDTMTMGMDTMTMGMDTMTMGMDTMTMGMDTMTMGGGDGMGMDTMTMGGGDGMGMDTMTMGDGMGDGEGMGMDTMTMGGGDGTGNGDGTGGGDGMGGGNGMGMDTMTMGMDTMTINVSDAIVWTGDPLTFVLGDNLDFAAPGNQDTITSNVIITRSSGGGQIFNLALEDMADETISPAGTAWAVGRTDDLENLTFTPFREAVGRPQDAVGMDLVLFLIEDNILLNVNFTAWSVGRNDGGGFTYIRATP